MTEELIIPTDDGPVSVRGVVLGRGESRWPHHGGHDGLPYAPKGTACSACRYMRVTIVDDTETDEFVVITEGVSTVPGERTYGRVERTTSATWMVDYLRRTDKKKGWVYLPRASRKALLEAGAADRDIDEALEPYGQELVRI